jgi:hypothetical protein
MLFHNIAASTLATLALLFSPALSLPSQHEDTLSAQALDLTVKYYGYNNCADGGGPNRDYSAGACLRLPESSHGVKITGRRQGCYCELTIFLTANSIFGGPCLPRVFCAQWWDIRVQIVRVHRKSLTTRCATILATGGTLSVSSADHSTWSAELPV